MKKVLISKVYIFGEKWSVFHAEVDDAFCGHCEYATKEIVINKKIKKTDPLFLETLLHEYLHALFYRMSYRQSGITQGIEEVMIDQISKGLTEAFQISIKKR